jgi:hypothetical protein
LLNEIGDQALGADADVKGVAAQLEQFRRLLERPSQDTRGFAAKAESVAARLAAWDGPLQSWKCDPASLMKKISRHEPTVSWRWEEATQRYLALAALEQARYAIVSDDKHQRIQNELSGLARRLAFHESYAGPSGYSEARLLKHFQRIREQLGR